MHDASALNLKAMELYNEVVILHLVPVRFAITPNDDSELWLSRPPHLALFK